MDRPRRSCTLNKRYSFSNEQEDKANEQCESSSFESSFENVEMDVEIPCPSEHIMMECSETDNSSDPHKKKAVIDDAKKDESENNSENKNEIIIDRKVKKRKSEVINLQVPVIPEGLKISVYVEPVKTDSDGRNSIVVKWNQMSNQMQALKNEKDGQAGIVGNQETGSKSRMPSPLLQLLNNSNDLFQKGKDYYCLKQNESVDIFVGKEAVQKNFHFELSKALRLKPLIEPSPHWVKWIIKSDGLGNFFSETKLIPALAVQFRYLPKLDIIVVESDILMPHEYELTTDPRLSDVLLRAENVLHYVKKDDFGFECPTSKSRSLLDKARTPFYELVSFVGYPYCWAQDFCNVDLQTLEQSSSDEDSESEFVPTYKSLRNTIRIIIARFNNLLKSWKETRATEFRCLLPLHKVHFTTWKCVELDVLQRSFQLSENIYLPNIHTEKGRLLMSVFSAKKFEIRIAAILHRKFPVELPSFKIEVIDKRKGMTKFVNHKFLQKIQEYLSKEELINGIEEESVMVCQILKIIYFVDELLKPKTLSKVCGIKKDGDDNSNNDGSTTPSFRIPKIKPGPGGLKRKQVPGILSPLSNKIPKFSSTFSSQTPIKVELPLFTPNNYAKKSRHPKMLEHDQREISECQAKKHQNSFTASPDESANLDEEDVKNNSKLVSDQQNHFSVVNEPVQVEEVVEELVLW